MSGVQILEQITCRSRYKISFCKSLKQLCFQCESSVTFPCSEYSTVTLITSCWQLPCSALCNENFKNAKFSECRLQRTFPAMRHTENRRQVLFLSTLQAMRKKFVSQKRTERDRVGAGAWKKWKNAVLSFYWHTHTHTVSKQPGAMENATLCAATARPCSVRISAHETQVITPNPMGIFLFSHSIINRRW